MNSEFRCLFFSVSAVAERDAFGRRAKLIRGRLRRKLVMRAQWEKESAGEQEVEIGSKREN